MTPGGPRYIAFGLNERTFADAVETLRLAGAEVLDRTLDQAVLFAGTDAVIARLRAQHPELRIVSERHHRRESDWSAPDWMKD